MSDSETDESCASSGNLTFCPSAKESVQLQNKQGQTDHRTEVGQTVDRQTLDGQTVDRQTVDGQTVDGQTVDRQTVDRQTVDRQTVDGKTGTNLNRYI